MTTMLFPQGAALVIGGSGGLGAACALQFARDGSAVALTYNSNEAAGQEIAQQVEGAGVAASLHQLNTADTAGISRVIAEAIQAHGRIHTLVFAAAGVAHQLLINEFTDALWQEHLDAEVTGFYKLVRGLLPHFKQHGGGSIVHIGSAGDVIWPARDGLSDRVAGLDAGADDYVVKPVHLDELAARLRRLPMPVIGRIADGALILDLRGLRERAQLVAETFLFVVQRSRHCLNAPSLLRAVCS